MTVRWALERVANPAVLRIHTAVELTQRTIETCPPGVPPPPLDALLGLAEVRSLDLHRYRVRLNLEPVAQGDDAMRSAAEVLASAWGPASPLPPPSPPRPFAVAHRGPRRVAESLAMAEGDPILAACFGVTGVEEAVAEPGRVLVRLGRLFHWEDLEDDVEATIRGVG